MSLHDDPTILGIAGEYLGVGNPIVHSTNLYWSFSKQKSKKTKAPDDRKLFHFDVSDSKAVSLFFYLTDVDETSGGHTIIAVCTHNNRTLFNLLHWRLSEKLALKRYKNQIRYIAGKKGTGFFEDLLNYHKHTWALTDKPRLMLTFNYVIHRQPDK